MEIADLDTDIRSEKYEYLRIWKAERKCQSILMFETVLCLKSFDNFQLYFLLKNNN